MTCQMGQFRRLFSLFVWFDTFSYFGLCATECFFSLIIAKVLKSLVSTQTTLPHHEPPAHPQMRHMRVFLSRPESHICLNVCVPVRYSPSTPRQVMAPSWDTSIRVHLWHTCQPVWGDRHPTTLHPETCRSKPFTEFRCPQGIGHSRDSSTTKCTVRSKSHYHWSSTPVVSQTSFRTKISESGYNLASALHCAVCSIFPKSAVASISTARCTQILRKRNVVSSASKRTNGKYVFPWTSFPKRRRPRPPINFLTCFTCCSLPDQVTNKLVDVALGPQTTSLNLFIVL